MRTSGITPLLLLAVAGAMLPGAAAANPAPGSRPVLPFFADDYAKAIAEARERKLPLFVESWAPW